MEELLTTDRHRTDNTEVLGKERETTQHTVLTIDIWRPTYDADAEEGKVSVFRFHLLLTTQILPPSWK